MNVYYTHAPVEGPHYASKNAAIAVSGAAYRWRQGKGGVYRMDRSYDKGGRTDAGTNKEPSLKKNK